MFLTDLLWNYIACILLASFGGLARVLNMSTSAPVTWQMVTKEVISSTFAGVLALLVCVEYDLTPTFIGAICGGVGFAGVSVVTKIINPLLKQKTGVDIDKKEE